MSSIRRGITLLTLLVLSTLTAQEGFSQSRIPGNSNKFLANARRHTEEWHGDLDQIQVIFFEVPDTVTGPLHFGVYDPGVDESAFAPDYIAAGRDPVDTNYYLYGGTGAISDTATRKHYFAALASAQTGTLLRSFTEAAGSTAYDGDWRYFGSVYPSQGEHIGNKYYFKIIVTLADTVLADCKNAYQLDISTSASVSPTGISGVRAFAYSLTLGLYQGPSSYWNFYPFIPDTATAAQYVNYFNWDFDSADTGNTAGVITPDGIPDGAQNITGTTRSGLTLAPNPSMSEGNASGTLNTIGFQAYQISAMETSSGQYERAGTWGITIQEVVTLGGYEYDSGCNLGEIWFTLENDGTSLAADDRNLDAGAELLRIYASPYIPALPHHVSLTAEDGQATVTPVDTEEITLTIVDSSGNPVPYSRTILVSSDSGTATIDGGATALLTTDADGLITFTVGNSVEETVTISILSDGTAGTDRLPFSGTLGVNGTVQVVFADTPPTIASGAWTTITAGTGAALPILTVDPVANGQITAANDLYIRIPGTLDAVFDTSLTNLTFGGPTAKVQATVTYPDSKTLRINVLSDFVSTDVLTIDGLAFTSVNSASAGALQLSVSGTSGPYVITSNVVYDIDAPALFQWTGATNTTWGTNTNWTPNTVPTANDGTENLLIATSGANNPVFPADYNVNDFIISTTSVFNTGTNDLTISDTFTNNGTLQITEGGSITSGLSCGNVTFLNGVAASGTIPSGTYNNLTITSGAWVLGGNITVTGNLTINGGTLSDGGNTITLAGNWDNNVGGAAFTATGALILNGSGNSEISGTTTYNNFTCNTAGKTLRFESGSTQTVNGALTLTGASGNLVTLQGTALAAWTLNNGAGADNVSYVSVQYSNAITNTVTATYSTNGGNNNANWIFSGKNTTWSATAATSAIGTNGNWTNNAPVAGDNITIQNGTPADPVLTGNWNLSAPDTSLTINSTGILDLVTFTLTMSAGGTFQNDGTLRVSTGTLAGKTLNTDSGTVIYHTATATGLPLGDAYRNLTIESGNWTLDADLVVYGNLAITGGTLNTGGFNITVYGNFSNAGTFTAGTGEVILAGTGSTTLTGNTAFNNLTCTVPGKTVTIAAGSIQTVSGTLTLTGSSGSNLTVTGTGAWTFNLTGSGNTAGYVALRNCQVTGTSGDLVVSNGQDLGGNDAGASPRVVFTTEKYWNGPAGGNWNTAGNWIGGLPTASDNAVIPAGSSVVLSAAGNVFNLVIGAGATINLAGNNLNIYGDTTYTGTPFSSSGGALVYQASPYTITGNITTNNVPLTFNGAVLLAANATVNTGTGRLIFNGTINENYQLTLRSSNRIDIEGIVGGITPLNRLATNDGPAYVGADITTSGSTLWFFFPVILTADVSLTDNGAGIFFFSTVATDGTAWDLTCETSNTTSEIRFANTVGGGGNPLGDLTLSANSLVNIDNNITLTGAFSQTDYAGTNGTVELQGTISAPGQNISFGSDVTLTNTATLDTGAGAGDIEFSETIDGNQNLTLTGGSGTITLTGIVGAGIALNTLTLNGAMAAGYPETHCTTLSVTTTSGHIVFTNASNAISNFTATAPGNQNISLTNTSALAVTAGNITTVGGTVTIINGNSVTVTGTINAGSAAGIISITTSNDQISVNNTITALTATLDTAGTAVIDGSGTIAATTINLQTGTGTGLIGTNADNLNTSGTTALNIGSANVQGCYISHAGALTVSTLTLDPAGYPVSISATGGTGTLSLPAAAINTGGNILTLSCSSGNLVLPGALTVSTGTMTVTSAGNLEIQNTVTAGTGGITLTANGTITDTGASGYITSGGAVVLDATGAITLDNASGNMPTLTIQRTSAGNVGAVTLTNNNSSSVTFSDIVSGLTLNLGGATGFVMASNADINGNLTVSGGTFNMTGRTVNVSGNTDISGAGTLTATNSTLIFDGTSDLTTNNATQVLNSITIAAASTLALQNNITMTGNWITNATGNLTHNNRSVTFSGTAASTINSGGTGVNKPFYTIISQKTGAGSLAVVTNDLIISNALTLSSGTFSANNRNISIAGNADLSGASTLTLTGTTTLIFNGTSDLTTNNATQVLNNVTIAAASTLSLQNNITMAGSWITNATGNLTHNNHSVTFSGTAASTINSGGTGVNKPFYTIISQKTGAGSLAVVTNDLIISNALTLSSGTFSANNRNISIAGNADLSGASTLTLTGTTTLIFNGTSDLTTNNATQVLNNVTIAAASTLSLQNNITMAGSWITNATGNLTHNNHSVTFSGTAASTINSGGTGVNKPFYTIISQKTGAGSLAVVTNDLIISNALTLTSGTFSANNRNISIAGNADLSGASTLTLTGTTTLNFNGTSDLTTNNATQVLNNVTIAAASTLSLQNDITMAGSWITNATGNLTHNNHSVTFSGTGPSTITSNSVSFYSFVVSKNAIGTLVTLNDALDLNGSLTLSLGTLDAAGFQINIAGTWDNSSANGIFTHNSNLVVFDGATQTLTTGGITAGKIFYNVEKTGAGTLTLGANDLNVDGDLTLSAGTFDANTRTLYLAGDADLSGAGTLSMTGCTLIFDGTSDLTTNNATQTLNNLTVASTFTLTLQSNITLAGNVTVNGTLNANGGGTRNITLAGNWTTAAATGTFNNGSNTVTFNRNGDQTLDSGGTAVGKQFFDVQKTTGGNLTLTGNQLSVTNEMTIAAGRTLDLLNLGLIGGGTLINDGTVQLYGSTAFTFTNDTDSGTIRYFGTTGNITITDFYNLTINGANTYTLAGAVNINGSFIRTAGTFSAGGFTVNMTGTEAASLNVPTLAALVINKAGIGANTVTLTGPVTATNITITAGSFLAAGQGITFSGNWTNSDTFTHGNGTVTITGAAASTSTLTGSTVFYTLGCTIAGKTLIFEAGSDYTFANQISLQPPAANYNDGNRITVRSDDPGVTRWNWVYSAGTVSLGYVQINDCEVTDVGINNITVNLCEDGDNNDDADAQPHIIFTARNFNWDGSTDTDWGDRTNWDLGSIPNWTDSVTVANIGSQPATLDTSRTVNNLTITGAVDTGNSAHTLTVNGTFANNGLLYRRGGDTVTLATPANMSASGTVRYHDTAGTIQTDYSAAGNDYFILEINDTGEVLNYSVPAGELQTAGNLVVNGGTLSSINQNISVGGDLTLTGNLTFTGTGLITVTGTSSIGGTFTNANGNSVLTGDISHPAAGTRRINSNGSGSITFDGNYSGANNGLITLSSTGNITFNGDFTGTGGTLTGNNTGGINPVISFYGAAVTFGTLNQNSDMIAFRGGLLQDFNSNNQNLGPVTINKTGNSVRLAALATQVTNSAALTLTAGTLNLNGQTWRLGAALDIPAGTTVTTGAGTLDGTTIATDVDVTISGGTLTHGTGSVLCGSLSLTGGTYNGTGTGTLTSTTGDIDIQLGTFTLGSKTITTVGLTQTGGTFNEGTGTIDSSGSISVSAGTFNQGTTAWTMDAGATSIRFSGTRSPYDLTINSAGTITISTETLNVARNLTVSGGTFNTNNFDLAVGVTDEGILASSAILTASAGRNITVSGDVDFSAAGDNFVQSTGTLILTGLNTTIDMTGENGLYNVEIDKTGAGNTLTVINANVVQNTNGVLTMTQGILDLNDRTWQLGADLAIPANTALMTGSGILDGTTIPTDVGITISGGTLTHEANGTVRGASLTVTSGSYNGGATAGTLTSTTGDIEVSGGTLTLGDKTVNTVGITQTAGTGIINANTADITSTGAITLSSGTFNANTAVVSTSGSIAVTGGTFNQGTAGFTMTGAGTTIRFTGPRSPWDLTISTAGTISIDSDPLNVANDLTITSGTFDSNGQNQFVGGDFLNGGTYTAGATTLTFNGTLDADFNPGSSSFANLTVTGTKLVTLTTNPLNATGTLTINNAGSVLELNALNLTLGVLANNGTIRLTGTQTVTITTPDTDSGTTEFHGAGGNIGQAGWNDFHTVNINGNAAGSNFSLNAECDMVDLIVTTGTVQAGANLLWIHRDFDTSSANGSFNAGTGTVRFTDNTVDGRILGDNTFNSLVCSFDAAGGYPADPSASGKQIYIESGSTQTFLPTSILILRGSNAVPPPFDISTYPATSWLVLRSTIVGTHWFIHLETGATTDFYYLTVHWSDASYNPIILSNDYIIIDNCIGWYAENEIQGSWTEDTNHNGKIDRIRVEVRVDLDLTPDFSSFEVSVTGFDVIGYQTGSQLATPWPTNPDKYFFILLAEQPDLDTDARPVFQVIENASLIDNQTGAKIVVPVNTDITPVDQAEPVIGYTLAVAGNDEVYVRFSEPVTNSTGGVIAAGDFILTGGLTVSSIDRLAATGIETEEVLLQLSSNITVDQALTATLMVPSGGGGFRDLAANTIWAARADHRITDIGLGIEGNGLVQPVYARDEIETDQMEGVGIANTFDGTDWLQPQEIQMQVHLHSDISTTPVELAWDTARFIDSQYINNGLWIPNFSETDIPIPVPNPFSGLVPYPYPLEPGRELSSAPAPGPNLFDFTIPGTDSHLVEGTDLEFFLYLPAYDIYCGRLTDWNAANWYRLVRPWTVQLRNIKEQAGQVTILNNIINPEEGERVTIHYILKKSGTVLIQVFDLSGSLVQILQRGKQSPGEYSVVWDGRNKAGNVVARGVYYVRFTGPDGVDEMRKVLVVK
jgi:hypothetical protein